MKIVYISQLFNTTYRINHHYHDYWEIVYYTKGSGIVNIDGEAIPFTENDIFVLPPSVPHFDYSGDGFRNYHFNFVDDEFGFKSYLKLHDTEDQIFKRILELLYSEYHLKRDNYTNIIDSLYEVLRNYIHSFVRQEDGNPYVDKIVNSIIENLSNPNYKVNDAMKDIPMHKDYIRKLFLRQTGMTPLQYLTHRRLSNAKQLLDNQQESRLSLKEIAFLSGFDDYYYFSRVFKQEFGLSPNAWRKHPQKTLTVTDVKHDSETERSLDSEAI